MVKQIPLSKGYTAIVSDIDADLVQYSWHVFVMTDQLKYARRLSHKDDNGKWVRLLLHREIMERVVGRTLQRLEAVDHIDNDGLNDCRDNLRVVNASQNSANRRMSAKSKSGYKGVTWVPQQQKWVAAIGFQRKKIHLGTFTDKHEAARAYNAKALELHGQYARLNVIDESL